MYICNKRVLSTVLACALLLMLLPAAVCAAPSYTAQNATLVSFTDTAVTAEGLYPVSIDGTVLTVSQPGIYVLSGSCADGYVSVSKNAGEVNLVLNNLTLSSTTYCPVETKGGTNVVTFTTLAGTVNTLSDTDRAEEKPKSVINASKAIFFDGEGKLVVNGNNKNGIKSDDCVTVLGGILEVNAIDTGIAADNVLTVSGGTVDIRSTNGDALKANPDAITADTAGDIVISGGTVLATASATDGMQALHTLTVSDGSITVNAADDGMQADHLVDISGGTLQVTALTGDGIRSNPDVLTEAASGCISISGGDITVVADHDGMQAANEMTISGGTFNITTGLGYQDTGFDGNTESAKGLKVSRDAVSSDTLTAANVLTVSGGSFTLDCADDAIHTDGYIYLTGGSFTVRAGDDAVHADTSLFVGTQNSEAALPRIDVLSSYEGLEAGTVYMYSGNIDIIAADDGINAAGDSGSNDPFNPGGGGHPGGGFHPGSNASDYQIFISGGDIYVNCEGDGIDANGNITISGGKTIVFSMRAGGDNSPFDADGSLTVSGGTVFGAGSSQMATTPSSTQGYVTSKTAITSGKTINVKDASDTVVFKLKAVKNVNYVLYSPAAAGYSIVADDSPVEECQHNYVEATRVNATCTQAGYVVYTCSKCNSSYRETLNALGHTEVVDEAVAATCTEEGLTEGKHCSVCEEVLVKQETVAPLGHDWDEGTVTTAPTLTEKGEMTYSCSRCDAIKTEEIPEIYLPFTDVPEGKWYTDAVAYVYANNLMSGTSATTFDPDGNMTRAMLVTVLWRLNGETPAKTANTFTDVPSGQWYTEAVSWAAENGIVAGIGGGKYNPNGNTTREQIAAVMYRYAQFKGYDTSKTADLAAFPDSGMVSGWAKTSLAWANAEGLISGSTVSGITYLAPQGNATRSQVAAILMRYVENIVAPSVSSLEKKNLTAQDGTTLNY